MWGGFQCGSIQPVEIPASLSFPCVRQCGPGLCLPISAATNGGGEFLMRWGG